jgi:hypothetical protein
MEITRGPSNFGPGQVRVWHEEWDLRPGEVTERTYVPTWPEQQVMAGATCGPAFTLPMPSVPADLLTSTSTEVGHAFGRYPRVEKRARRRSPV